VVPYSRGRRAQESFRVESSQMDISWKSAHDISKYIPMDQCRDGWLYSIAARNATLGIYRKGKLGFEILRKKMGSVFSFVEYHWDVGTVRPEDAQYGTVKPIEMIEVAPTFEDEKAFLDYMKRKYKELSTPGKETEWRSF